MTDQEIQILADACRMAGIDATKIKPENPFERSGKTADFLQAAVAEIDPVQAAKWRVAAGGSLSLATMAELQTGDELSAAAQQDLWNHDAQFVDDVRKQREQQMQSQLQALEKGAEEMRWKRELRAAGGNEHQAKRTIQAEDQANAEHLARVSGVQG